MYTCVSSDLGLSVLREQFSECNLFEFIRIFVEYKYEKKIDQVNFFINNFKI